jgi:hypothetical protein
MPIDHDELERRLSQTMTETGSVFDYFSRAITTVTWLSFNAIALASYFNSAVFRNLPNYPRALLSGGLVLVSLTSCILVAWAFARITSNLLLIARGGEKLDNAGLGHVAAAAGAIALVIFITYALTVQAMRALQLTAGWPFNVILGP